MDNQHADAVNTFSAACWREIKTLFIIFFACLCVCFPAAAVVARVVPRRHEGSDHHTRLPQCAAHRTGQRTQEVHLVLWFDSVLHHPRGRAPQPSRPAADTRRW